ncbi:hypothetical protein PLICRDRAFT_35533 [Plicaturopsis crispa FD-325 SS-3]|nr:hypothetical protein PLICRDRAFT_35533 [Plicaturopsis crispa FD-325 SS-3]
MPSIEDSKCILVIGATAGIGRALALSFRSLPSKPTVIAGGRRLERLNELATNTLLADDGGGKLETIQVDVNADRDALKTFVDRVVQEYPELDAVVFSAGIQHQFNFADPAGVDLDLLADELNTNYVSIVTMITFFLPHLIKLGSEGRPTFIVPITSGLAIVPGAWVPNYSATKAALHSLSLSLSAQLKDKNVHIMEILPPLVESELHDHQGTTEKLSQFWMPLEEFTDLAMEGLQHGDAQIAVGQSSVDYEAREAGKLDAVVKMYQPHK